MRRSLVIGRTALLLALAACARDPVGGDGAARDVDARVAGDRGVDAMSARRYVAIRDACDPDDPAWVPTGGCVLRDGDVTEEEFTLLLATTLTPTGAPVLMGHPAWRNEPSYLSVESGQVVRVRNEGGRNHTFTRVAQFGGGRVPPLNIGVTPAPECFSAATLAPGAEVRLEDIPLGLNRYMCCIHPWMRAAIRVSEHAHGG